MPNVESAFATMEGRITTDVASAAKQVGYSKRSKVAFTNADIVWLQDSRPNVVSPSPAILSPSADISPQTSSNEVLNNFVGNPFPVSGNDVDDSALRLQFQGLIAGRRTPSSTPVKSPNPTDTKS